MQQSVSVSFAAFNSGETYQPLRPVDLQTIRNLTASPDLTGIEIHGLPCGTCDVWIEEDLEELLTAYQVLEQRIHDDEFTTHTVFLRDGGLLIETDLLNSRTKIQIRHTPYLNKSLSQHFVIESSVVDYLSAWRGVVHSLLSHAKNVS